MSHFMDNRLKVLLIVMFTLFTIYFSYTMTLVGYSDVTNNYYDELDYDSEDLDKVEPYDIETSLINTSELYAEGVNADIGTFMGTFQELLAVFTFQAIPDTPLIVSFTLTFISITLVFIIVYVVISVVYDIVKALPFT